MGRFLAWFFAAAIVIGACSNAFDAVSDPASTTSTTTSTTTTTIAVAEPSVPTPQEGSVSGGGSRAGNTGAQDPSYDEIDCASPEDAIDDGWDEEDVLDHCGMEDSELEEDYQDW